jgi:hypothetical protein
MKQLSLLQPNLIGPRGRDISLQKSLTHIQYQYVGNNSWTNLVDLNALAPEAIRKTGGVFSGNIQFKGSLAQTFYPSSADNIVPINLSFGSYFWLTLTENVTSFEIINAPPNVVTFTLVIEQNTQSVYSVDFDFGSSTIKWANNDSPDSVVSGLGHMDVFLFSSKDQGATWFAQILGQDFKSNYI